MIRATIFRPAVVTAALVAIGTVLGASTSPAADNWPQFRGPGSRGVSDETDLPDTWSRTQYVVWTAKIPGRGWSSPVIWGDRIFLTSAEQLSGKTEKVKPGLYFGGERLRIYPHRWKVF